MPVGCLSDACRRALAAANRPLRYVWLCTARFLQLALVAIPINFRSTSATGQRAPRRRRRAAGEASVMARRLVPALALAALLPACTRENPRTAAAETATARADTTRTVQTANGAVASISIPG